jgi:peptidoglycan/LPS O-acetylase OafA/YrhL
MRNRKESAMKTQPVQRQDYLDWLRVLGVLAVILYHTTRLFNSGDWHVKEGPDSTAKPGFAGRRLCRPQAELK